MTQPISTAKPATNQNAFECPHCHAYARQRWFWAIGREATGGPHTLARSSGGGSGINPKAPLGLGTELATLLEDAKRVGVMETGSEAGSRLRNIFVSRCDHCGEVGVWVARELVWPKSHTAPLPSKDMPEHLAADYLEAARIVEASPRGAAALLRLLVQKLCDDLLGRKGGNLNTAIQDLVDQGLAPEVQAAFDIVRVVGNQAVHPGQIDLRDDRDTAINLFSLVNLVVDQTITRRKQIDSLMMKLPESARTAIKARRTNNKD